MHSLHKCLLSADMIRLRAIARFWNVDLTNSRQRDAAAQLVESMNASDAVADAWDALSDDQRQALEALLAAGGRMPARVFFREWGEIRTMGPGRMEREQPWREPVSSAEGLWYKGFIARAFDQAAEGAYEIVFVPPELLDHLPAHPTPKPSITLEPTSAPVSARRSGDALLDDVCTLLAYFQNERVLPNADGGWPTRHETHLIRRMRDPDPARFAFLRHLVQRLGWLQPTPQQGGSPARLRPDPGPVTNWLRSPAAEQRRALVEAWRDDPTWNDLFHVPNLHPEDTGPCRNNPLLPR